MSNAQIVKIGKVNVDKLELQFPKEVTSGSNVNGFFVHVKHNKVKLRVLLPDVVAPYGAGPQKDYGVGDVKYSMGICFDGMDDNDANGRKIRVAYDTLSAINERIKQLMMENREAFFKDAGKPKKKTDKPLSDEVLESRYKSFLRDRDGDRSDIMYLSLQRQRIKKDDEDKFTAEEKAEKTKRFQSLQGYPLFVDNEGSVLDVTVDNIKDLIPWGTVVRPIIELAYLWVSGDKVSPIWAFIHGARISTGPSKPVDLFAHDSDDDEESNDLVSQTEQKKDTSHDNNNFSIDEEQGGIDNAKDEREDEEEEMIA